jgi:CRISPR/Cas system CSM-associated protein Csm3 (group 7 of RAMP superfamily)
MKTKMMIGLMSLMASFSAQASTSDFDAIEQTIRLFAKAGDENNADELAKYLDANYRIVMNQLFGSTEVTVMTREVYLEKIRTKEFGGDKREVTIEDITLNGKTANAKVMLKGTKMTFVSMMSLVKDSQGVWKLISDTPVIL